MWPLQHVAATPGAVYLQAALAACSMLSRQTTLKLYNTSRGCCSGKQFVMLCHLQGAARSTQATARASGTGQA